MECYRRMELLPLQSTIWLTGLRLSIKNSLDTKRETDQLNQLTLSSLKLPEAYQLQFIVDHKVLSHQLKIKFSADQAGLSQSLDKWKVDIKSLETTLLFIIRQPRMQWWSHG